MKIIAFLEDEEVNEKILRHLGLWEVKVRPPPKEKVPFLSVSIDYSDSQIPFSGPSLYPDPEYPMDSYVRRAGGGSKGGSLPAGRAEIPIFPASEGESHSLGLPAPMDSSFA